MLADVVDETLAKLGIKDIPIIKVYNKIDKTDEPIPMDGVKISAKSKINLDSVLSEIEKILFENLKQFEVFVPYKDSHIVAYCQANAEKLAVDYQENLVNVTGYIHYSKFHKLEPYTTV